MFRNDDLVNHEKELDKVLIMSDFKYGNAHSFTNSRNRLYVKSTEATSNMIASYKLNKMHATFSNLRAVQQIVSTAYTSDR